MSLLCSLERAKLAIPAGSSPDDRIVAALVAACSSAIEKYLRRRIAAAEYDELHDGVCSHRLMLRQWPVQRVDSVRFSPQVVLQVSNTSNSTIQQARVEALRDGLRLTSVASGAMTVDTSVTWSANATLQAVAAAVNALGNGWSAAVVGSPVGDYGLWPSRDLWIRSPLDETEGGTSFDCRGRAAGLSLHVSELGSYAFDARGWLFRRDPWADVWPMAAGRLGWEGGPGYWRVRYVAGYTEVPPAIEEACAEWVADLFGVTKRDPATTALIVSGVTATHFQIHPMPPRVAALLAPWRAFHV